MMLRKGNDLIKTPCCHFERVLKDESRNPFNDEYRGKVNGWKFPVLFIALMAFVFVSCHRKNETTDIPKKDTQKSITKNEIPIAEDSKMVFVPAGTFIMGSDIGNPDEKPVHSVSLDDFYIDKYELTNRRYNKCVEAKVCAPANNAEDTNLNGARQPVVGLSWLDCMKFCRWEGKTIPTEAQWEKAARGTDGRNYPWGSDFDIGKLSCFGAEDGFEYTAPVGSFPSGASPYGAMDMAGNVKEFTRDWYNSTYYGRSPADNPPGADKGDPIPPDNQQHRTARGGSWRNDVLNLRCTLRNPVTEGTANDYFGCRCVSEDRK